MHYLLQMPPSNDPTKWIAILVGGFALLYLVILRPMMRKKKKDPLEPQPFSGMAQQRALERDMQGLLVEYEKMIRNMTAGVDTRAVKLELLIKEADEKIAELRAATASAASGNNGASVPTFRPEDSSASVSVPPSAPPPGPDPRHLQIYELADQGLPARDIARRLDRPSGEIELILALRGGRD